MRRLLAAGIGLLACGLFGPPALALTTGAAVRLGEPIAPMGGLGQFATAVEGDVTVGGDWDGGALAVGGNILLRGRLRVTSTVVNGLALVVGGTVDAAPGVPEDGVTVGGQASVGQPGLIDFAGLFDTIRERSAALSQCDNTVTVTDGRIDLATGRTNVLNLTGDQLDALEPLTFDAPPTSGTPLLINVRTDAGYTWRAPQFDGITREHARHILFNFPDTVELRHIGGAVRGTIYAPQARVIDADPASIEGAIVARELQTGTGETKANPFTDLLHCEPAPPSPEMSAAPSAEPLPPPDAARHAQVNSLSTLSTRPEVWFGLSLCLVATMILIGLRATRKGRYRSHK